MKLRIQKLHPDAKVPTYGTAGAACFDLYALADQPTQVIKGYPFTYRTGLAFEVPDGHVMLVYSRSGHGFKHGVRLANCVGVVDSDYRGELLVKLTADDVGKYLEVREGDRIAQAMIVPVERCEFEVSEQLTITDRDQGGFGSTGR